MKFDFVEDLKANVDKIKGKKWLTFWNGKKYYGLIMEFRTKEAKSFLCKITDVLDEALLSCLEIKDVEEKHDVETLSWIQIVDRDVFLEMCEELTQAYRKCIKDKKHYPYMTLAYLREIMEKNDIPEDVRLMSDSGWECDATDMGGVFYHRDDNIIVFTQSTQYRDSEYSEEDGWKAISHKWDEREVFFVSRYYNYKKLKGER